MMVLFDEINIREIYAFPKTNQQELMTDCPRAVQKEDLDILGIELKDDVNKKLKKEAKKS
jgi:aspartyl-tRNA synthetase